MSNIFEDFNNTKCCGCGNCINVCPVSALSYSQDDYGFIIPNIDTSKCIDCGRCISVCPYKSNIKNSNHPQKAFAAVNNDKNVLFNSASGGIFYEFAKYVLSKDGVVFGAAMLNDFYVKHIEVSSLDDISALQKSKYIQSDLSNVFKRIKTIILEGKLVLFSGTPCQVTALYSYLNDCNTKNLFTIDIVCHGVPSYKMFCDYISVLEKKLGNIEQYVFRAKKKPNNGMNDYVLIKTKNKKILKNWCQDSYNGYMMKGLSNRDCCYTCKFSNENRLSDCTLMDYWRWDYYFKDDFEIDASVSGIVINSEKGIEIFDLIKDRLHYVESSYEYIKKNNPCICNSSGDYEKHRQFMNVWKERGYDYLDKKYVKDNYLVIFKSWIMMHLPQKFVILLSRRKNGY